LVNRLNDYIENGVLRIDADEIEDELNDLRSDLIIIAATFDVDNPEFICVMDYVGDIAVFNDHED